MRGQGGGRGVDVGGVGGVLAAALGGAHAQEVDAGAGDLGVVGGEPQPAGGQHPGEQLVQAGLEQRRLAGVERVDLGRVHVDGDDGVTEVGHAGRVDDAEVSGADDGEGKGHPGTITGTGACARGRSPKAARRRGPPGGARWSQWKDPVRRIKEAARIQAPGAEVGHAFRTVCSPGLADGPRRHRARPALGRHGGPGRARRAGRRLGVDLGLRPLPHGARAVAGGDPRGVDADGRARRGDQPRPPGPDVHLHELPQPGLPGQGRRDDRHHLRGPGRDGHRRRVVRARVAGLRLRLPHRRGAHRPARRGRPDLP